MNHITSIGTAQSKCHRITVELASNELEIDSWGIPVPVSFKKVDIIITTPSKEMIERVIESLEYLKDYAIVDYWRSNLDDCPF